jgi:hypothetical protein
MIRRVALLTTFLVLLTPGLASAAPSSASVLSTEAGSWPYYCSLHPQRETGTIAVPLIIDRATGT